MYQIGIWPGSYVKPSSMTASWLALAIALALQYSPRVQKSFCDIQPWLKERGKCQ